MKTFTDRELKVIRKLERSSPLSILTIEEACPLHSYCNPLPIFRLYKIDDTQFEAQWNDHHRLGVTQLFRFGEQE